MNKTELNQKYEKKLQEVAYGMADLFIDFSSDDRVTDQESRELVEASQNMRKNFYKICDIVTEIKKK